MGAQGRQPEPPMTNWGNVSKNHASIPQDTAEHNRDCQQTRASCLLPRVLVLHRFPNNSSAGADEQKENRRTAGGTQGRLRGALAISEIAKYVE